LFRRHARSVFEKLQSTNLAPIVPGTIDIHADVDLSYEIVPIEARPVSIYSAYRNLSFPRAIKLQKLGHGFTRIAADKFKFTKA